MDNDLKQLHDALDGVLRDIPKLMDKANEIKQAEAIEHQAIDIAKAAIDQLDSNTVDVWTANGFSYPEGVSYMDDLDKIFSNQDDIIKFGKAIGLAKKLMEYRFIKAKKHKPLKKISKAYRENVDVQEMMLTNAAVYFVLLRFKRDVLEQAGGAK